MDPSSYITVWVLQAGPRSDFYLRSLWTWGELLHNFPFRSIQTMNNSLRAAMLARQRDTVLPLMFLVSFFSFCITFAKVWNVLITTPGYKYGVRILMKDTDAPEVIIYFKTATRSPAKVIENGFPSLFGPLPGRRKRWRGGSICGEKKNITHLHLPLINSAIVP